MNKLIVGNWKMCLGLRESSKIAQEFAKLKTVNELVLCPSAPYLTLVGEAIAATNIKLGAQDCANRDVSSFTGGVSAAQLKEIGCGYCIVGHSERRIFVHETAQEIHDKIKYLIEQSITPILCVGEDVITHKAQRTMEAIAIQLNEIGFKIDWSKVIVAYEPIWAIGTGMIPTSGELSQVVELIIKKVKPLSVLYGGSVNKSNIADLASIEGLGGFLIGSASTKVDEMKGILDFFTDRD
jgi:triosephosphate isomerase